jgi:bacteriocin-like protein
MCSTAVDLGQVYPYQHALRMVLHRETSRGMTMTSELTINELDAVTGGDMTSQVGNRVTTAKPAVNKETGPGMIAFVAGWFLGMIL